MPRGNQPRNAPPPTKDVSTKHCRATPSSLFVTSANVRIMTQFSRISYLTSLSFFFLSVSAVHLTCRIFPKDFVLTYDGCTDGCDGEQVPFDWPAFSQQFSPWLTLINKLPFGAENRIDFSPGVSPSSVRQCSPPTLTVVHQSSSALLSGLSLSQCCHSSS